MTDEQARELVTEGTAMENETRLLSLKAENVMRLKVVELEFDPDGELKIIIPFSQAGNAEKLRVSTAMGLAMNKDLKLLLIDDGERLDKNGKKILAEMAAEAGATILMSCVTDDPSGCSVIIEDGVIKDA